LITVDKIANYVDWVNWVSDRTKWKSLEQITMLKSMAKEFEALSFTPSEITKACQKIFFDSNGRLKWSSSFSTVVCDIVIAERAKEERVEVQVKTGAYECESCDGSGFVNVPHKRAMKRDAKNNLVILSPITMICTCRCILGRNRLLASADKPRPVMQIEVYESEFPGWKAEMQRRHDAGLSRALSMAGLEKTDLDHMTMDQKMQLFGKMAKKVGMDERKVEDAKPMFPHVISEFDAFGTDTGTQEEIHFDDLENGRTIEEHIAMAINF
jgi:hypothetical protein